MATYIIHTPKSHYKSIFEPAGGVKIWGMPDRSNNRGIWNALVKNDKFIFVCKAKNNYQIVGLGFLEQVRESAEPILEWEPKSHEFPLRMIFSEIKDFRNNPEDTDFRLPQTFSIVKGDYNAENYFDNKWGTVEKPVIEQDTIRFLRLILKFGEAILTKKISLNLSNWIPIRFLEPLLLEGYDWREFEKIIWDIFRALDFKVEKLGHKCENQNVPDFKLYSEETPPAIGGTKFTHYSPDTSEERKILEYWRAEKRGTSFIIVAKGFEHSKLLNIAKQSEKESLGTFICITYANLLSILMMKLNGDLPRTIQVWNKLIELKEAIK
ncbi:MAG: hypothetical protein ABIL40_11180 [candidate division WOR-3 bacterium]